MLSCPACKGTLWVVEDRKLKCATNYRCQFEYEDEAYRSNHKFQGDWITLFKVAFAEMKLRLPNLNSMHDDMRTHFRDNVGINLD